MLPDVPWGEPDRALPSAMDPRPRPSRPRALALCLALLPACIVVDGRYGDGPLLEGDGVAATVERSLGAVEGIELEGPIDLDVTVGAPPSLVLHADANLLEHLETRERSGRLVIRFAPGYSYRLRQPVRAEVSLPELSSVRIAGSSDVRLEELAGERLTLGITGSANVVARGRVGRLDVSIAGAGGVDADELVAEHASIAIAGSGDAALRVERRLDVSISGSGDVRFRGEAEVSVSIQGSGDVTRIR